MKKKTVYIIVTIIILLSVLGLLTWSHFSKYYSISDRNQKIKNEIQKTNYPILGWVRVQGTNIDYPVIYALDDNFDVNNSDLDYGFAWKNYYGDKKQNRIALLGHNIRNVSSHPLINEKSFNNFENLPSFIYYSFVKENKYIQYSDGENNYLYKIYAVYLQETSKNSGQENLTKEEMKNYISKGIKNSYFKFDVDVNENDKILTLMTCTRIYDRQGYGIVIDARRVRKDEAIKNYNVTKKSKYNKIEKFLEGDEENEKA